MKADLALNSPTNTSCDHNSVLLFLCADGRPASTCGGARARVSASSTPPVFGSNGKLLVVSNQ